MDDRQQNLEAEIDAYRKRKNIDYAKRYYRENREALIEYQREYRRTHKEQRKQYMRNYMRRKRMEKNGEKQK